MPPKGVTLASFLPAQFKPAEPSSETTQQAHQPPRPPRCRCEGPFDLCWRYPNPAVVPNAACKPTWDRILAPFQFKGREWTIVELRQLWPLTVQALNERLMKGRMERTLKEDLQDDIQVLIDLIQYSCKPHPRPPRAGMKTLIVQGRILAEAIAQDALFQLDPSDPSAPRPDRDLVDLINRLREHHPQSLLAPALHVLRTLGNTAVHLDREAARLSDGEIGDAAAVVCRFVVLVVDAYMQMCANLHRHEQREEALAQPLEEAPVAPIPAPHVLLRPREAPAAAEEPAAPAAAAALAPAASAPAARPPRLSLTGSRTHSASCGSFGGGGGGAGGVASASRGSSDGGADDPSAGGGRRSHSGGSVDEGSRVPYSLVQGEWGAAAAQPHVPAVLAAASGSTGGARAAGSGGGSPASRASSRGWWPPLPPADAAALAAVPSASPLQAPPLFPLSLLRRPPSVQSEPAGGAATGPQADGLVPAQVSSHPPGTSPPEQDQAQAQAASLTNWLQGHPAPYSLPSGSGLAIGLPNGTAVPGAAGGAATTHLTLGRATLPPQPLHHAASDPAVGASTAPYMLPPAGFGAVGLQLHNALSAVPVTCPSDPWDRSGDIRGGGGGGGAAPAGGSPRRSPLFLVSGASFSAGGSGGAAANVRRSSSSDYAAATAAAATFTLPRGSSPQQARPQPPHTAAASLHSPPPQQQLPLPRHLLPGQPPSGGPVGAAAGGAGAGAGGGAGAVAGMGPQEASKRLLQLCAGAQAPPAAKVQQLLQAGATLSFVDKSGMSALHMACYWCHAEAARLLLERHPGAATAPDREGRSPLWVACQRGHVELVEALLAALGDAEAGAAVHAANASNVTPLRVASAQGHTDVVEALLRAGAKVDIADKDGFTPLYVACARSHLEVVRLLLAAGAPPDRADKAQRTPLWAALHPGGSAKAEACPERRAGVVRALLAAGADVHLLQDGRDRDYCWQLLAQSIAAGE